MVDDNWPADEASANTPQAGHAGQAGEASHMGEAPSPGSTGGTFDGEAERLSRLPSHETPIEEFRARIGALEAEVRGSRRAWFRDATSIVAILALAFSFGTTVVSLNRTNQQDQ